MKIYVAGPYSADTDEGRLANTQRAMDIGLKLMRKGWIAFIPHLTHFLDNRSAETTGERYDYNYWMDLDREMLKVSDAIFYIAPSAGADDELEISKKLRIAIYTNVEDVPTVGPARLAETK